MTARKNPAPGGHGAEVTFETTATARACLIASHGYPRERAAFEKQVKDVLDTIGLMECSGVPAWPAVVDLDEARHLWWFATPIQRQGLTRLAEIIRDREKVVRNGL